MKKKAYERFRTCYQELPDDIQKKVDRQITRLSHDFQHPSLHCTVRRLRADRGFGKPGLIFHTA